MSARIVLSTLNAKYIHASLGLRYLQANMGQHGSAALQDCTVLREFTIHRPAQEVVDALLQTVGDASMAIVGFGVYIWNVTQTTAVVHLLKAQAPQVKIVLGGPEVSHEWESQEIVALADYLITGWGDVSFPQLCKALVHGPQPLMKVIAGIQPLLEELELPYALYSADDLAHRVIYVEASRGCPFKCAFCLSALDKTAWAFPLEPFLEALAALYQRGARNFKFVDRTFNMKIDVSVRILQFFLDILQRFPNAPLALHFEVIPDHLPDRLKAQIQRFPAGVLQLEVGIQSFNVQVQQAIARKQDNALSVANLRWLREESHAHLHTDLIFGLPGETWESFAQGFDQLYALRPHEIQLGVLKRLRGTPLARQFPADAATAQTLRFDPEPPYTVHSNACLAEEDLPRFMRLARYWDLVANSGRFPRTLALLLEGTSAFHAFALFSHWLWTRTGLTSGITPEDLVDHLHAYWIEHACGDGALIHSALLADYVASGARASPAVLRLALGHGTAH
jgi:hypothetical protein